jgi:Raf kinase inhibitor-like YbhB/YbcL family protein
VARTALAVVGILTVALAGGCGGSDKPDKPLPKTRASLRLGSPAFRDGGKIPRRYTCDAGGVSPPLRWSGVPRGTRELALLVEDADAGHFVHWTLLGIPPGTTALAEGRVPKATVQTENGFGDRRWGGPCPPEGKGPHRYVFALYALDRRLGLGADASADEVRGKVAAAGLASGALIGKYER